ncbi:MAG: DUF2147 domain-containing protein [Bacteroidetes bacterium]|nr:MAG: DUF2147 domain-containing protein [Bacteroidota bacterium]
MKRVALLFLVFILPFIVSSQDIIGKWKTIDGQTGKEKAIVEIYKEGEIFFGKITEILQSEDKNVLCEKCEGIEKNKPVLGLVLIKNMLKDGKYYRKGTIFDPEYGKKFRCRLKLTDDPDILQVRGYVAFLYASQYWHRVK